MKVQSIDERYPDLFVAYEDEDAFVDGMLEHFVQGYIRFPKPKGAAPSTPAGSASSSKEKSADPPLSKGKASRGKARRKFRMSHPMSYMPPHVPFT